MVTQVLQDFQNYGVLCFQKVLENPRRLSKVYSFLLPFSLASSGERLQGLGLRWLAAVSLQSVFAITWSVFSLLQGGSSMNSPFCFVLRWLFIPQARLAWNLLCDPC